MTKRNDISVPDGYFQQLEQRLQQIPSARQEQAPRGVRRLAPYFAYAASLVLLAAAGNLILRKTAVSEETDAQWNYVSYLAQELDPDGLVELKEAQEPTDEDIRSYLLADNSISVELIASLSYEENY